MPSIFAALDDTSGMSSEGGEARPCTSTDRRREDDLPPAPPLLSLSRVDIDLEMGGVLVNMLGIRDLPGIFSVFSKRSAFSDPESLEEVLSEERFDGFSDFDFEEDEGFLSSFFSSF